MKVIFFILAGSLVGSAMCNKPEAKRSPGVDTSIVLVPNFDKVAEIPNNWRQQGQSCVVFDTVFSVRSRPRSIDTMEVITAYDTCGYRTHNVYSVRSWSTPSNHE